MVTGYKPLAVIWQFH